MRKPRKSSSFLPIAGMIGLVIAAIATPSAAAVNILPDDRTGAVTLVLVVTVLLTALVVEVWRQTGRGTLTDLEQHIADSKARSRRRATR